MGIGILCFPAGFDNDSVQGICGKEATDYSLGTCRLKWAFILGLICLVINLQLLKQLHISNK